MYTPSFFLLALLSLGYCVVAVLLIKKIVALKSNKEEADKGWKIKVNFDTSKATNPATGLPPISDIEIEGSEKNIKTLLQENDTVHISEKQKTKTDITFQQDSKSVATGIDNGIKYGLIIGIPIVFIILIFINHAKRQKNTSK